MRAVKCGSLLVAYFSAAKISFESRCTALPTLWSYTLHTSRDFDVGDGSLQLKSIQRKLPGLRAQLLKFKRKSILTSKTTTEG